MGDLMDKIEKLRTSALERKIPIIKDDGIQYLVRFIKDNSIKSILEIGSAVGYSSICMAYANPDVFITTIELDEERFNEACANINEMQLQTQIECFHMDATDYIPAKQCDMLFIDAAKTKNKLFFDKFSNYIKQGGYIVIDNIYFYGLVDKVDTIRNKRTRKLVEKIKEFKEYVLEHQDYESTYLQFGDGLIIAKKK